MRAGERYIDVVQRPARVRCEHGVLHIESDAGEAHTVALADLAGLSLSHPAIGVSVAAIASAAEAGIPVILGDGKRMPTAMILPLVGHSTQGERLRAQASASLPTVKRIWKSIVISKIRHQASVLSELGREARPLLECAGAVKSGDSTGREAVAARLYWTRLFDDQRFRRSPGDGGINAMLDYGYAVVRATVARAICAAGLHPGLGVQHHNRYDAFPLANDLMEPFRPIVDRFVHKATVGRGPDFELEPIDRRRLAELVQLRVVLDGESRTVTDVAFQLAVSVARRFEGSRASLALPSAWW